MQKPNAPGLEPSAAIAEELIRRAVPCRGGVTWLTNEPAPKPLGPFLYSGTAGIGLFLAAYSRVSGDPAVGETALQAVAPLGRKLLEVARDDQRAHHLQLPIGGLTGLGSFLYALVRIGEWLGRPDLFAMASELSGLITPSRIEADDFLDVVHGAAGALLGLLALHQVEPARNSRGDSPLELARLCGRHLLRRRIPTELGGKAWPPGKGTTPQTGFSHGAAGICYALVRLSALTGEPQLLPAIADGLAFERAAFVPEVGNWRDLRRPEVRFMRAWCHGAPGIVLSRVGMLGYYEDAALSGEIEAGLASLLRLPLEDVDHLCCGTLGWAEILSSAHQRLQDRRLQQAAEDLRTAVVARAADAGSYCLVPGRPPGEPPLNLLKGLAGVGFGLLRGCGSTDLPTPLLLE